MVARVQHLLILALTSVKRLMEADEFSSSAP